MKMIEKGSQIPFDASNLADSNELGRLYEGLVYQACISLLGDGRLDYFEPTEPNSADDRIGVDGWVGYAGEDIPIQVKGRRNASSDKKKRRTALLKRGIEVVNVYTWNGNPKPIEAIREEIMQKITNREGRPIIARRRTELVK